MLFYGFQSIYCYLFHLHLFNAKAKAQKKSDKEQLMGNQNHEFVDTCTFMGICNS